MFAEISEGQTIKSLIFQSPAISTIDGEDVSGLVTDATINGLLWDSGSAEQFISDKFKASVDAVAMVETLVGIDTGSVMLDGATKYTVVNYEDVADQAEAYIVYLKEVR